MKENNKSIFLFGFPLEIRKKIRTLSGLDCFMLIWLKCCFNHAFTEITITKIDRDRIQLSHKSYINGLLYLEEEGLITVRRAVGKNNRIAVNTDLIDKKAKNFVRGVK